MASASSASGGGELAIVMLAVAPGDSAADGLQGSENAVAKPEKVLNSFLQIFAVVEWAGNAFGAFAFLWATVVLLGGFCSSLKREDFWFATVLIFIEAFRIYSRGYKMDNQSLFGTTRAVTWISSSFSRVLARPQEGNEVVLIMGLGILFVDQLVTAAMKNSIVYLSFETTGSILKVALLILMSKLKLRGAPQLTSRQQRRRHFLLWAGMIASIALTVYVFIILLVGREYVIDVPGEDYEEYYQDKISLPALSAIMVTELFAVFLLSLRPRPISNLTSSGRGRMLLFFAKVISAVWLAFLLIWDMFAVALSPPVLEYVVENSIVPLTIVVLSLGSLQTPANSLFGRWIDAIMHILFLLNLLLPFPPLLWGIVVDPLTPLSFALSLIVLLAALLIGNLQIPLSMVQVLLSCFRLMELLYHLDHYPQRQGTSPNMVPALAVFYVLAFLQATLYNSASLAGMVSFFPRRLLVRQSKFSGLQGAKAIDLYYQRTYATRMEIGVFAGGNNISFANFAIESLSSSSRELQTAGVCVLDNILQRRDYNEELITRVTNSNVALSTLISMLGWTAAEESNTRLFAARVTRELADRLGINDIPGMVKLVSLLLDAENVVDNQTMGQESSTPTTSGNGGNAGSQPTDEQSAQSNNWRCSWVCRCWQRMKENWSVPDEPPLSHKDSFPVLGMEILEKLSCDPDNCAEIVKATNLISKIIRLIGYTTINGRSNDEQQKEVICSALKFVRQLAITGETTLRQQLWKNPFLLNNLTCILQDSRSIPQMWEPAMHVISKLALDEEARQEIGGIQLIIGKLMHAFIGKDGENRYYDQSLRLAAAEALANLAMENTANCLAILKEPAYEVIKNLKDLLRNYEYRCIAGSILQNFCAHLRDELFHLGASQHLSSALQVVMENIMSAEDKHLEVLIGLASHIGYVIPQYFAYELGAHTNRVGLVKRLVDILNSNRRPNPEYPRMRRVIVYMVIFAARLCDGYANIFKEEGMTEALSTVQKTPSKVETYRVFLGNEGMVLERDLPLRDLAARAKEEIDAATSGQPFMIGHP